MLEITLNQKAEKLIRELKIKLNDKSPSYEDFLYKILLSHEESYHGGKLAKMIDNFFKRNL